MKLHVFKASSNQEAISMIQEKFGPDALIYNTRSVHNGVEMLAGPPLDDMPGHEHEHTAQAADAAETKKESAPSQLTHPEVHDNIDAMKKQLHILSETVVGLSRQINTRYLDMFHMSDDDKTIKRNYIFYYLNKLGFRGNFCHQFANQFLNSRKLHEDISEKKIESALLRSIKTGELDLGDEKVICALVGPTGVGKTTTIAKLANQYITKYGPEGLGLITTDFNDITGKNRLLNYSWLFNVSVEFVSTADEMENALEQMRSKKCVLIDTHGVSQRDSEKIARLLELIESQGKAIQVCIVLPGTAQEAVLDEIARAFSTPNLHSCILTKQDECISLASAVSVCLNYKMRISYVCDGQDINQDIHKADGRDILHQIISESGRLKNMTEENLFKNTERAERPLRKKKAVMTVSS